MKKLLTLAALVAAFSLLVATWPAEPARAAAGFRPGMMQQFMLPQTAASVATGFTADRLNKFGTAPTCPTAGYIFYDTTADTVKACNNALTAGAVGTSFPSLTDTGSLVTSISPIVIPSSNTTAEIAIAGNTTSGLAMIRAASGPQLWMVDGGTRRGCALDASGLQVICSATSTVCWNSSATDPGGTGCDTNLVRDAAVGVLALKSSNTPQLFRIYGGNGGFVEYGTAQELLTLSTSGTTTDTTANLLPANSYIDAVDARVTTTITTATSWQLGDATTPGRFSAVNSTMTVGTTQVGTVQADQTGASGPRQVAAAKVRVTTVGTPGAGVIRIMVHYHSFTPPTS